MLYEFIHSCPARLGRLSLDLGLGLGLGLGRHFNSSEACKAVLGFISLAKRLS